LHKPSLEAQPAVLVIGGGLAGMVASLRLADLGFQVILVERERELGGNLRHIHYTLEGSNPQEFLKELIQKVEDNPAIALFKGAELVEHRGLGGSFRSNLSLDGEEHVVEHGATIVATGGQEALPQEYLYGQEPRVITQRELEARIASGGTEGAESIIMIQCVGSREEGRPYCSRICCSQALKNALKIKEAQPETAIFVLYRDMRTYGFKEEYYRRAREAGVIFIPYERDRKPRVIPGPALGVEVYDPFLGRELRLEADLLALSPGIAPGDNGRLAQVLNLPLDEDGFFQEANPKVAPLDSRRAGVFLCGLAQGPKSITESISQAEGAAMRAAAFLAKGRLEGQVSLPTVNHRLCSGCGLCVSLCPYEARVLDQESRVAEVIEALCQGCGVCAMVCPNGATQQRLFQMGQLLAMIDAAL
jgi:heterodisulfide reductase subunit A